MYVYIIVSYRRNRDVSKINSQFAYEFPKIFRTSSNGEIYIINQTHFSRTGKYNVFYILNHILIMYITVVPTSPTGHAAYVRNNGAHRVYTRRPTAPAFYR